MLLRTISIGNYKSYLEPQSVRFAPGVNLLIGSNNSGKTTLLEALDLNFGAQAPHRSIWNLPMHGQQPSGRSSLKVSIATTIQDLRKLMGNNLMIPIPDTYQNGFPLGQNIGQLIYEALLPTEIIIHIDAGGNQGYLKVETILGCTSSVQLNSAAAVHVLNLVFDPSSGELSSCHVMQQSGQPAALRFDEVFRALFYRFSAQRYPAALSSFSGIPATLATDASNLAFCLSQLQLNDAHGHKILCGLTHRIFPTVRWVQAPSMTQNQWEIRCLPRTPEERREDLYVPLSQMGAGIGNVLAILYVVMTSRRPQVIAIDEPNSFLHPRALRELLQILANEGAHHQYVLTGHSADMITSARPNFVTMFNAEDGRTRVRQVEGTKLQELRGSLGALGIRMTELHGRDQVLWVEGQTEELVIPELLKSFFPEISAGTGVLRVEHTSKFDRAGKEVEAVVDAYARLTSSALVPPAVAIIIDTEKRKPAECKKLERDTNGRLRFLPLAMLENYALHAGAIAAVLAAAGEMVAEGDVQHLLDAELMLNADNGAKILKNVFNSLSETRVEFKKTTHTPQLFDWLIEHAPEHLNPLRDFLRDVIQSTLS